MAKRAVAGLSTSGEPDIVVSRDGLVRLIESKARSRKDMSAEQLLRAHRKGTLEKPGEVGDVLVLANLLPEDDPLFGDGQK